MPSTKTLGLLYIKGNTDLVTHMGVNYATSERQMETWVCERKEKVMEGGKEEGDRDNVSL